MEKLIVAGAIGGFLLGLTVGIMASDACAEEARTRWSVDVTGQQRPDKALHSDTAKCIEFEIEAFGDFRDTAAFQLCMEREGWVLYDDQLSAILHYNRIYGTERGA